MIGVDRSESISEIAPALVAALGEVEDVAVDRSADAGKFSYRYATLAAVLAGVRPILAGHGLCVLQPVHEMDSGAPEVTTILLHTSGEWVASSLTMTPTGRDPQAVGSAISYARRYSLLAMLGIATEDDDGAKASTPRAHDPRPARDEPHPPSPSPQDRAAGIEVFEALKVAPEPVQAVVRRAAETAGRSLRMNELTGDPAWRAVVAGTLEAALAEHARATNTTDPVGATVLIVDSDGEVLGTTTRTVPADAGDDVGGAG